MSLRNADVADLIDRLGDLYELDGAVVYRVLAYRKAAARIRSTGESVARLQAEGRLTELQDVGDTIAAKIDELAATGSLGALQRLEARLPAGLVEVMRLPGVGAKTTRRLHEALGITGLDDLRAACEAGHVREVKGLGAKAEERITAAIAAGAGPRKRVVLLDAAIERAEALLRGLREHPVCVVAAAAGSLRRRRETVGDIDLIAGSDDATALIAHFLSLPEVAEVTARGETKASVLGHDGVPVDLRVVPPAAFGNLLQHFTGSKAHNVALRERAVTQGLSVSEWGIQVAESGAVETSIDEDDVYRRLGYEPIPPELRENAGELEAARAGALPRLVEVADIRGDLHTHTTASDGKATIEQMAAAARARGYGYLAVTDHSAGVGMGIGLDADALLAHAGRIRALAGPLAAEGFTLLAGCEVDVMADGSLYFADDVLAELDWVVASLHVAQGQDRDRITSRLVGAASSPHVDVIGHPTGRMLGRREPYDVDIEALVATCLEHGTFLEVNANPRRLDLAPPHVRLAVDAGVPLVISTDAHRMTTLANMPYGVAIARRGWATAAAVLNTRPWPAVDALRKAGRRGQPAGSGRSSSA